MSEQVLISRELLARMRDLIYVLAHREDSIGQDAFSVGGHFPELLAQPDHGAQHLNMVSAQPAGEVPEVVAYQWLDTPHYRKKLPSFAENQPQKDEFRPLMTIAQHTRIVAALQARAVVLPERMKTEPFTTIDRGSKSYKAGWNGYANEYERLNGKGGV